MPRSRYQQQESANKRWRKPGAKGIGRPRPVAYEVVFTPPRPPDGGNIFKVDGTDANALQRAYKRARRRADNVNGFVNPLYK